MRSSRGLGSIREELVVKLDTITHTDIHREYAYDMTHSSNVFFSPLHLSLSSPTSPASSYNVFEALQPYITYKINVTVQELDFNRVTTEGASEDVWRTIGFAEIGPDNIGQNTNQNQVGSTSGPNVKYLYMYILV